MNFDKAVAFVLKEEGGYIWHPNDPGGETKYGISKRAYPNLDIKSLTVNDAKSIYLNDYWIKGKCDLMPDNIKLMYFDSCVNHGLSGAAKLLQRTKGVDDDGVLGPITMNAVQKGVNTYLFAIERLYFYMEQTASNHKKVVFLRGWYRRVKRCLNYK